MWSGGAGDALALPRCPELRARGTGADPDSVLLCQRLPPLVVMMTMFYTRPCSTPTSLPNKDYIGTKGERAYRGVMLWGSGAAYQWDTLSPCAPWGTGDAGRPRMGFPRSRSCQHPPLVHSLPPPNAHRGTRGHPEQHRCKSRARLWGWHKGGCSAGYCGCTLSKQHLQGAPSIYPKRAVGLLLGRCAAGPCSPACCMPSPSSGMVPTPPPTGTPHCPKQC